jgi:hypothetical protein
MFEPLLISIRERFLAGFLGLTLLEDTPLVQEAHAVYRPKQKSCPFFESPFFESEVSTDLG